MWHSTPVHWVVHVCLAWLVLLCTLATAEPVPVGLVSRSTGSNLGIGEGSSALQKRDNGTFLLRIMPLGASITNGYGSTDHNGYRKALRQQLRYEGWQVNMIGSLRNGTMHDNVSRMSIIYCTRCRGPLTIFIASRRTFRLQDRPIGSQSPRNNPPETEPDSNKVSLPLPHQEPTSSFKIGVLISDSAPAQTTPSKTTKYPPQASAWTPS